MLRLRDRNKSIPNGFQMYDPILKWRNRPNMSFQGICEGLRIARLANPGLTKSKGLSTDPKAIEAEVDLYNASVAKAMGWTDYYLEGDGGSPIPFPQGRNRPPVTSRQPTPPNPILQKLRNVAAGSESLVEWLSSGAEAVPQEQAEARASVCVNCPLNGRGGWEKWFTGPVSNAINKTFLRKDGMKLHTTHDADLGVCEGCSCPLGLSVWIPIENKVSHMAPEVFQKLPEHCWVVKESTEKDINPK